MRYTKPPCYIVTTPTGKLIRKYSISSGQAVLLAARNPGIYTVRRADSGASSLEAWKVHEGAKAERWQV